MEKQIYGNSNTRRQDAVADGLRLTEDQFAQRFGDDHVEEHAGKQLWVGHLHDALKGLLLDPTGEHVPAMEDALVEVGACEFGKPGAFGEHEPVQPDRGRRQSEAADRLRVTR